MGQGVRIERINPCPQKPSSKMGLSTNTVSTGKLKEKKDLNWDWNPRTIFVVVSLIIVLLTGLVLYLKPIWAYWEPQDPMASPSFFEQFFSVGFLWISILEIIILGALWNWWSVVGGFNKAKQLQH